MPALSLNPIWVLLLAQTEVGTSSTTVLPTCEKPMLEAFERGLKNPPGLFWPAAAAELQAVDAALRTWREGDLESLYEQANAAGYRACWDPEEGNTLLRFQPRRKNRGRPWFAMRKGGAPLILEAPHPYYDLLTRREALRVFEALQAQAVIISGNHRCASPKASPCDGRTTVCKKRRARYRTSDAAHYHKTVFQTVHQNLADAFPESIV